MARTIGETLAATTSGPPAGRSRQLDSGRGWLMVVGAMAATFTVFGVAYSFGAFFGEMSADFGTGKGKTTLLFGIANFVYFTGGIVTGRLCDRIGPRPLLAAAAASLTLGLWLTSLVDRLWVGYLTYGLGVGVAVACAYVPMVSSVGGWFVRRRTAAVGLAVAGIGLGSLSASYVSPDLIDRYGWREAYRIFAVVGLVLLVVALVLAERPPAPAGGAGGGAPTAGTLRDISRTPSFRWLYASMFAVSQGLFIPFVFLPSYATAEGVSAGSASTLVGLIGGSSIFGRLVFGSVGGRLGVLRLYELCIAAMSVTLLLWLWGGGSYPVLVLFSVLFGVVYGGFIALAPAVAAQVFGVQGLGGVLGALYTAAGFGGIGLYLAGEHIQSSDSYTAAIVGALVSAAVGAVLLLPLRRHHQAS